MGKAWKPGVRGFQTSESVCILAVVLTASCRSQNYVLSVHSCGMVSWRDKVVSLLSNTHTRAFNVT